MDRLAGGERGSDQAHEQRFVLRDALPEELDEVAHVILRAYEEYTPSPLPEVWEEAWNAYWHDIGDVRGRFDHTELIVAERAGRIVGTVTFYPDGTEYVANGWPAGWVAIRLLAVVPEARCQGIGRALMTECLRRARRVGAPSVGLYTMTWMRIAQGMYERMGFRRVPELDYRPVPVVTVMAYRLDLERRRA